MSWALKEWEKEAKEWNLEKVPASGDGDDQKTGMDDTLYGSSRSRILFPNDNDIPFSNGKQLAVKGNLSEEDR
jgi:hypothetical protein